MRLAERKVMGVRKLVPLGKIDELLRSSLSPRETAVAIAEYLDTHAATGDGASFSILILPFARSAFFFPEFFFIASFPLLQL
jgi:hypothetical protein